MCVWGKDPGAFPPESLLLIPSALLLCSLLCPARLAATLPCSRGMPPLPRPLGSPLEVTGRCCSGGPARRETAQGAGADRSICSSPEAMRPRTAKPPESLPGWGSWEELLVTKGLTRGGPGLGAPRAQGDTGLPAPVL